MCGLFGVVSLDRPANEFRDRARGALHTLSHRGPDQWSEFQRGNVYMGHRRLTILDLSDHGRQPMVSDDGNVATTVNGEIYNFPELRRELGEARFRSRCDSESVLHGYRAWGIGGLLKRLDGMYAFAVFDGEAHRVFLARDRIGIKPLYYARMGRWFAWASELKAITEFLRGEPLEHDTTALYDFLTYRYIPAPKTAYRSIFKLPPGHALELDLTTGAVKVDRYWRLECAPRRRTDAQAADELRTLLAASVRSHLVSDVPLGCFLSGGLDSSIVAAHAAADASRLDTFSVGFDQADYDETPYADIVARALGTQHHVHRVVRADSVDLPARLNALYDEPHGDYSALPTWAIARFARERVTVILSGDGGDELFGGYPWYRTASRILRLRGPLGPLIGHRFRLPYRKRPGSRLRALANVAAMVAGTEFFELYAILLNGVSRAARQSLRPALAIPTDYDDYWHFRAHYRPELGRRMALQYMDLHTYLPEDILTKVDRATMAVALECRVPFLSKAMVEFAFSLDERFIYRGGRLKGGLKYAYRDVLPREIIDRRKKGFGIPVAAWQLLGDDESFELPLLRDFLARRTMATPIATVA